MHLCSSYLKRLTFSCNSNSNPKGDVERHHTVSPSHRLKSHEDDKALHPTNILKHGELIHPEEGFTPQSLKQNQTHPSIGLGRPPRSHRTISKVVARQPLDTKQMQQTDTSIPRELAQVVSAGFAAPTLSSLRHASDKANQQQRPQPSKPRVPSSSGSARPRPQVQEPRPRPRVISKPHASEAPRDAPARNLAIADVENVQVRPVTPTNRFRRSLSPPSSTQRPSAVGLEHGLRPVSPELQTEFPAQQFVSSQESISSTSNSSKRASVGSPVRDKPLQTKRTRMDRKGKQREAVMPFPEASRLGSSVANAIEIDKDEDRSIPASNSGRDRRERVTAAASHPELLDEIQPQLRTRGTKRASFGFDYDASRKRAKMNEDPRRVVSHAMPSKRPPRAPAHRPNAKPLDVTVPGEASRLRALEREKRIRERQLHLEKELAEKERRRAQVNIYYFLLFHHRDVTFLFLPAACQSARIE